MSEADQGYVDCTKEKNKYWVLIATSEGNKEEIKSNGSHCLQEKNVEVHSRTGDGNTAYTCQAYSRPWTSYAA